MTAAAIAWFAHHEARLAWRDLSWLLSGGRRRRGYTVALGLIVLAVFMHGFAYLTLVRFPGLGDPLDKRMLVTVTGTLALYGSLMLSQAMEAVTRAFYARGDLDLILSSPAAAWHLFAVRLGAMAGSIAAMALALAAPVVDSLAWLGGARWLTAYGVVVALAMAAVALAAVLTVALFHAIGPRRTRLVAQIVAAVIGGSFVIGVQITAIISSGTLSRLGFLQSSAVVDRAPDPASALWWPARAANGDWLALTIVILVGATLLGAAACFCAPRFGRLALAAAGVSNGSLRRGRRSSFIRVGSPAQALRHKEWVLLWRDPWLISQTLMQILYLLPPVFLLWQNFFNNGHALVLVVPVLIMAAGQLAGGLAWLAISGEDAPDLIASAPLPGSVVWRAKAEAVFGGVVLVFGPCVAALAIIAPAAGLVGLLGIAAAVGSAILIQFWYRGQVKRSLFRRRHVSSRIATFAEALSSTTWAGTGALAAFGLGLAMVPGIAALAIVVGAWAISPRRN